MSLPIIFSLEALLQLEHIVAWAGQHSVSVRLNLLTAIAKKVEGIERIPEMYAVVPAGPVCAGAWCRPRSAFTAACSPPPWK